MANNAGFADNLEVTHDSAYSGAISDGLDAELRALDLREMATALDTEAYPSAFKLDPSTENYARVSLGTKGEFATEVVSGQARAWFADARLGASKEQNPIGFAQAQQRLASLPDAEAPLKLRGAGQMHACVVMAAVAAGITDRATGRAPRPKIDAFVNKMGVNSRALALGQMHRDNPRRLVTIVARQLDAPLYVLDVVARPIAKWIAQQTRRQRLARKATVAVRIVHGVVPLDQWRIAVARMPDPEGDIGAVQPDRPPRAP